MLLVLYMLVTALELMLIATRLERIALSHCDMHAARNMQLYRESSFEITI